MSSKTIIYLFSVACTALLLTGCDLLKDKESPVDTASVVPAATEAATAPDAAAITLELSQGNFGKAADMATAATLANPSDPALFLLLARIEARRQNVGNAVAALRSAFAAGFHDPRGAMNHPDFDGIRSDQAFAALAAQYAPAKAVRRVADAPSSSVRAGNVSITETADGHSRIRAGDVEIRD